MTSEAGTWQSNFLSKLVSSMSNKYTEAKYRGVFWKFIATILAGFLAFFSVAFGIAVYVIITGPPTLNDIESAYLERFRQGQSAVILHEQVNANQMVDGDHTLYATLHVNPDASMEEIAHAYHKLAKMFHPDRNKSPHANKIFRQIAEAYDTLKDPHKRADYDIKLAANKNVRHSPDPSISMVDARDIFQMFEQMFESRSPFGSMFGIPSIGGRINPIHSVIPGMPSMVMPMLQMMGGMPNVRVAYNDEISDGIHKRAVSVSKLCYDEGGKTHCKLRVIGRNPN